MSSIINSAVHSCYLISISPLGILTTCAFGRIHSQSPTASFRLGNTQISVHVLFFPRSHHRVMCEPPMWTPPSSLTYIHFTQNSSKCVKNFLYLSCSMCPERPGGQQVQLQSCSFLELWVDLHPAVGHISRLSKLKHFSSTLCFIQQLFGPSCLHQSTYGSHRY